MTATETAAGGSPFPKLSLQWDTNTAVAVLVVGALVFLAATRRGFRPVLVTP